MKLFVDTSALLALILKEDRHHAAAAAFVKEHPRARFVMTELIVAEVGTRLRARVGAGRAVAVVRDLLRSGRYELVFSDSPLLEGALDRMERFAEHRLSLVDCASMELMARLGLRAAFAFDDDFRRCGFDLVP